MTQAPYAPDQRHRILISKSPHTDHIIIRGLTLIRPHNEIKTIEGSEPLIRNVSLELKPGDRVVITGKNGSGKTTLLRALNGDFPFGEGRIILPAHKKMVTLPQLPYIHDANFRAALSYPAVDGSVYSDDRLKDVLRATDHERLIEYLVEDEAEAIDYAIKQALPPLLQSYIHMLDGLTEQELLDFTPYLKDQIEDSFVPAISISHAKKLVDHITESLREMAASNIHPSPHLHKPAMKIMAYQIAKSLYETAWPQIVQQQDKTITGSRLQQILSGGEKQRFRFANALLKNPDILLMDEPTANLDNEAGLAMYTLIIDTMPKDSIIVSVSHKPELIGLHTIHIHVEDQALSVRRIHPEPHKEASPGPAL